MHTYILIFRCRWCVDAVFLAASVSLMWKSSRCPQSWINAEMYLCLRIIHIQMYDNDSQINPWQVLPAVFWCTEGNLCFSCWPLPRPRPHFTANTLIDADTWAVFFFPFQPVIQESCKTAHWEQMPFLCPDLHSKSLIKTQSFFLLLLQHQISL